MPTPERPQHTDNPGCEEVARTLEAGAVPMDPARLRAIASHCRRCPTCWRHLAGLAEAILSFREEVTCAECEAAWPALLEARRGPGRHRDHLRRAKAHLSRCQDCNTAFFTLSQLLQLEEQGRLEEPVSYPRFDLSFLVPTPLWTPAAAAAGAAREVRELVRGAALRARVLGRGLAAAFTGLPAGLRPVPIAAQAIRGGPVARGERLVLADPDANVSIILSLQGAGRGRCHLGIEVRDLDADCPLQGRVSLRGGSGEEITPLSEGRAIFADLGPAHYVLDVLIPSPGGVERWWRLPISLEVV